MIDLSHSYFVKNISDLKTISKDQNGNLTVEYMTESTIPAINFDKTKDEYIKDLHLTETPSSNDALLKDQDGNVIFIEFKNGSLSKEKYKLRKKIYDSLLIFLDITKKSISDTRTNAEYILVYNADANQKDLQKDLKDKGVDYVQPSSSFNGFAKILATYANKEHIFWGLDIFQNYCFKAVHTYTKEEFETNFISKLEKRECLK